MANSSICAFLLLLLLAVAAQQLQDGLTPQSAATSCSQIHHHKMSQQLPLENGPFWIVNSNTNSTYQSWCDFSGGWTLLMKTVPSISNSVFTYSSSFWTNTDVYQESNWNITDMTKESKLESFNSVPINELKIIFSTNTTVQTMTLTLPFIRNNASLLHYMQYGELLTFEKTLFDWIALLGPTGNGKPNCPVQGFNIIRSTLKVRIGLTSAINCGTNSKTFVVGVGTESTSLYAHGSGFASTANSACVDKFNTAVTCSSIAANAIVYGRTYFSCSTLDNCNGNGECVATNQCKCYNPSDLTNTCLGVQCFGINASDVQHVCNGHGNCMQTDSCICENGYTGANCSIPICYDQLASDMEVCGGNGLCIAPNQCQCREVSVWSGENCNITTCDGIASNNKSVCQGLGTCIAKDVCQCIISNNSTCGTSYCEINEQIMTNDCSITIGDFLMDEYGSYMTSIFWNQHIQDGILNCTQLFDRNTFIKIGGEDAVCSVENSTLKVVFGWTASLQFNETVTINYNYHLTSSLSQFVTRYLESRTISDPFISSNNSTKLYTLYNETILLQIDVPFERRKYEIEWYVNGTLFSNFSIFKFDVLEKTSYVITATVISYWNKTSSITFYISYQAIPLGSSLPPLQPMVSSTPPKPSISSPALFTRNITVSIEGIPKDGVISTTTSLTVFARVQGAVYITYKWKLFCDQVEETNLNTTLLVGSEATNVLSFRSDYFQAGKYYTLSIQVVDTITNKIVTAEASFFVNEIPYGGDLLVIPQTGQELVTIFELHASNWTDRETNLFQLQYSFAYLDVQTGKPVVLTDRSLFPNVSIPLPAGNPTLNFSLTILYRVFDERGAFYEGYFEVKVTPLEFTDSNSKLTFLETNAANQISNAIEAGNLNVAAVSTLIVSNYLQDEATDSVEISKKKTIKQTILSNLEDLTNLSKGSTGLDSNSDTSTKGFTDEFIQRQITILHNIAGNSKEMTDESSIISSNLLDSTLSNSLSKSLDTNQATKCTNILSAISEIQFESNGVENKRDIQQEQECLVNIEKFNSNMLHLLQQYGKWTPANGEVLQINSSTIQVQSYSKFSSQMNNNNLYQFEQGDQNVKISERLFYEFSSSDFSKWSAHVVYYSNNRYSCVDEVNSKHNLISVKLFQNNEFFKVQNTTQEFELYFTGNFTELIQKPNDTYAVCQYWDIQNNKWSSNGCRAKNVSESRIICACNHTTDFSVTIGLISPLISSVFIAQYSYTTVILMSIIVPIGLLAFAVFIIIDLIVLLFCTNLKQKNMESNDMVKLTIKRQEIPFRDIIKDEFRKSHLFVGLFFKPKYEEVNFSRSQKWLIIITSTLVQFAITALLFFNSVSQDLYFAQFLSSTLLSNIIIVFCTALFSAAFIYSDSFEQKLLQRKSNNSEAVKFEREILREEQLVVLTDVSHTPNSNIIQQENYAKMVLKLKRRLVVDLVNYMIPKTHIAVDLLLCFIIFIVYFAILALTCGLLHVSFGTDWKPCYTVLLFSVSFILLYCIYLIQLLNIFYSKMPISFIKCIAHFIYSLLILLVCAVVFVCGIIIGCTVQNWIIIECCIVICVTAVIISVIQIIWFAIVLALYRFPRQTIRFLTSNPQQMYYLHLPFYFQIAFYVIVAVICVVCIIVTIYFGLSFSLMNAVLWICTVVVSFLLDIFLWKTLYVMAKGFGTVFLRRLMTEACT